ncbi:MAG: HAMP domain-containing protein, partial [Candidatus Binatia bacterium]
GRSVSSRARALATTAERIAGGELELEAPVSGTDELALLGGAFNAMTANLRRMIRRRRKPEAGSRSSSRRSRRPRRASRRGRRRSSPGRPSRLPARRSRRRRSRRPRPRSTR